MREQKEALSYGKHVPAHSFPGGLKERPARREWEKDPTSILRRAVVGMLPKNRLRKVRLYRHLSRAAPGR